MSKSSSKYPNIGTLNLTDNRIYGIQDNYVISDGVGLPEQFGTVLTPSAIIVTPNITAAGYYEFEFLLFLSTNGASNGLTLQPYFSGSTADYFNTVYEIYPNDIAGTNGIATGDTSAFSTPISGAGGILDGPTRQGVVRIKGTFKFDGVGPGVLGIQLQSQGAGQVQIQERSSLRWRKIS